MATLLGPLCRGFISQHLDAKSTFNPHDHHHLLLMKRKKQLIKSINVADVAVTLTSDPPQVDITWQIVVGSLAGVTPFVVAGVEFSKRIVKQRNCEVCGGSGLVLKKKFCKRCPSCGGFLPWQSWRRFFTG
ncbi:hypothetical protein P3S67_004681 [Capsicum chacoense]